VVRCYIIWRNNHAYDERYRHTVARTNGARGGTNAWPSRGVSSGHSQGTELEERGAARRG
jgi:hypothetical protein